MKTLTPNPSPPGRGANFKRILRLGGSLLALVLLALLIRQQDWAAFWQALKQISWLSFGLVTGLMLASRLAVSGRWHILLRSGGVEIAWVQTARITFAGLFLSNFLPTTIGGDVARLAGALRLGYDRVVSLASLVVDRLVGMAGMGMAALSLLVYIPRILPGINQWLDLGRLSANVLGSIWIGKAAARLKHVLVRLWQALALWLHHPCGLLAALGFTWVHMLCTFGILWVLLRELGEPLPFWLVAGLWAVTYFITLVPVSVNGLGVQELSITFLFTTLGGVSSAAGLTLALFMRLLPMLASVPGALFLPGILAGEAIKEAVAVMGEENDPYIPPPSRERQG